MQLQPMPPWQTPRHSHIRNSMPCPLPPREARHIPPPTLGVWKTKARLETFSFKHGHQPQSSSSCLQGPGAFHRAQRHEMSLRAEPCSLKIGWIYYRSKHVINIQLCMLPADTLSSAEPARRSGGVFICRSTIHGATAPLWDGRVPA